MPLIDLKTDLKSLKFGKDRIFGGSSNQPYIKSEIPEGYQTLGAADNDFLLRGGITAISESGKDVLRLGKMFIDLKSPNGLFFAVKQNLLSRTAVRTQASEGALNEGIYTPLSTLAQAGVNAFGVHLFKQGLDPRKGLVTYSSVVNPDQESAKNRLVEFWKTKVNTSTLSPELYTYKGGPGSDLGIGATNINLASPEQRTGTNNKYINESWFIGKQKPHNNTANYKKPLGLSVEYNLLSAKAGNRNIINLDTLNQFNNLNFANSIYNSGSTFPETNVNLFTQDTVVLTQNQINKYANNLNEFRGESQFTPKIADFRATLRKNLLLVNSTVISDAPSYNIADNKTIEGRTLMGDPGSRAGKNLLSYTNGSGLGPIDKINALPIYRSQNVTPDNDKKNDLVKFRIAAIDNNAPNFKTFMHFRALLGAISDSYSATWNPTQYLGRGENFYTYGGFTRTISLSWMVAAQSKEELIPMYKKLNYLASQLAPDYSPNGYMRGPLVQLTIGGYVYEQPGFITSLTFDLAETTPWEIGINDKGDFDGTVKELPHMINVTGFSFTPIHNFIPAKQKIDAMDKASLIDTNGYGDERFISIANGTADSTSNYNNYNTGQTGLESPQEPYTDPLEAQFQAQLAADQIDEANVDNWQTDDNNTWNTTNINYTPQFNTSLTYNPKKLGQYNL